MVGPDALVWRRAVRCARRRRLARTIGASVLLLGLTLAVTAALAQVEGFDLRLPPTQGRMDLMKSALPLSLALMVITLYAAAISVFHIRARRLWSEHFEEQARSVRDLQGQVERLGLFLVTEKHFLVTWGATSGAPQFEGDPGMLLEANEPARALDFSQWLPPGDARELDRQVHLLRSEGASFSATRRTLRGDFVEIDGQPIAGRAVMSIKLVTGERLAVARLRDEKAALEAAQAQLRRVMEAIPQPVWLRDRAGRLDWVNSAYAQAVDAGAPEAVLSRQDEILDSDDRAAIRRVQSREGRYRGAVTAIFAGQRRRVDVIEVTGPEGGGGFALDVSELEQARKALVRATDAHTRTLDEMPTGVAIFDRRQQLTYSNRAFRDLFALDAVYLSTQPSNSELLDRLRISGRLPEASDYRAWKSALLAQYQSTEASEQGWNLPNGRALRVVITPDPDGGVTWLFEDETERFTLAASYDRLKNTQWETLMALSEGVGVFGSDGCLQLSNPAFARLWGLPPEALGSNPHIGEIGRAAATGLDTTWRAVSEVVCSLSDARNEERFEAATTDGRSLDIATIPLPDGATLVTVADVTDTVQAERRLIEHNEALKEAARLRTDFIRSVSFELRSPLNSVVVIAQSLGAGIAGPLTPRQLGYTQDLARAADAVLALTDDILDLASIESGDIAIERQEVDLTRAIEEAAEGLKDRLGDAKIRLAINIANGIASIRADETRLRHILFNLIADAVSYSQKGDTVRLAVRREAGAVVIEVSDAGRLPTGAGRQGTDRVGRENGLRYSLAKAMVTLHGGSIAIAEEAKGGSQVAVTLPGA